ncbi:MAG: hypothetical protein LBC39_01385 [Methanobrevibacter sp.]|jgi:hypothetical protein|nr:hypothetical protein [Candidatus Methanovirga aequatorialis]
MIKKLGLMLVLSSLMTTMYLGSVSGGSVYIIGDNNYSQYFNANGDLLANSPFKSGDTLKLMDMHDKNFNNNNITLFITSYNASSKFTNCNFFFSGESKGSTLSGLNLTGAVRVNDCDDISLSNNTVVADARPFEANGCSNLRLTNNTFKGSAPTTCCLIGFYSGTANVNIINNTFYSGNMTDQGGNVLTVYHSYNANISGNKVVGSPSNICWGINFDGYHSVIENNDISNAQVGIMASDDTKVFSNYIHDFDATLAVDHGADNFWAIGIFGNLKYIFNNTITVNKNSTNIFSGHPVKYLAFKSTYGPNIQNIETVYEMNNIFMESTDSWVFDEETYNNTNINVFKKCNTIGNSKLKGPIFCR